MNKRKTKLKYDNIFICASIIFLSSLFILYFIRFVYYFSIEKKQPKIDSNVFSEVLLSNKANLLKGDNEYYFYGKNPNNYVYYSGIIYRVVSVSEDKIKLVSNENLTSLVMEYKDTDYDKTYGNIWLNNVDEDYTGIFEKTLQNKESYLTKTKTCIDSTSTKDVKGCKKYNAKYYVGLLSIDEYIKTGAQQGFLNNGSSFWLSNTNKDNNYWYVASDGSINDDSRTKVNYYRYGIRPTITLTKDVNLIKGTGTKEDPYVITQNENSILKNKDIGSYIDYAGYLWRIIAVDDDDTVKLALAEPLKVDGKEELLVFDRKTSIFKYSYYFRYLNNDFYSTLKDTKYIVKAYWFDGDYNEDTSFDYRNIYESKTVSYVGTLSIGDMFIFDVDNIYLVNRSSDDTIYSIQDNTLFIDRSTSELNIRPAIYVKGMLNVSGTGTKEDPLKIEGEV